MEQKPEMGYCPFEYWLGWAQGTRHGTGAGARAAQEQGRGRWGGRQTGAGIGALGRGCAGRTRLAGRAGPAGHAGVAGERSPRGHSGSTGVARARGRQAEACCWASWLCTQCTQPIFGPVSLGIFPESTFWTLFMNPVHEHCSSQNFSKKKILLN